LAAVHKRAESRKMVRYNARSTDFQPFFRCITDMAGILIIAHAPFATALRECIAHIYGGLPARIGVIDVMPDCDPAEVIAFAHAEIERLKEENGALVLTDMFGATPANIAARLSSLPDVRVLAGVNLPMLVRAVCYRATPLDTLVDKALAGATKGIHAVGPTTPAPVAPPACSTDCLPALPPGANPV
jgi:PTS system ascorbate-specific IIA component